MASLYSLNKDLQHIQYLKKELKTLQHNFNSAFRDPNEQDFEAWSDFKANLLEFQLKWHYSELKKIAAINTFKRTKIEDIELSEMMMLEFEYFDCTIEIYDGELKFEAPVVFQKGLSHLLELFKLEFKLNKIDIKLRNDVVSTYKILILFIIALDELNKYITILHFEWLFSEFKCTVPVSYLFKRSVFLSSRLTIEQS